MKGIVLFGATLLWLGCSEIPSDQDNREARQKYPSGVSKAEYKIRYADGAEFQGHRIDPPFWWVGMPSNTLEIMIYDQDIQGAAVQINYPGVTITNVYEVENPNYLFVEVAISHTANASTFDIQLIKEEDVRIYPYELKSRTNHPEAFKGLTGADVMYLIMPDRFANGDPNNDSIEGMLQTGIDRSKMYFRHGGDLQGIIDRLDYLVDLGITAIWLNPVQENNQPYESYHGYAITDHYKIDRRFGNNELFKILVEQCHEKGIKVIMDIIHNHVGDQHFFIKDLPDFDWIHQPDSFIKTTYRDQVLMDPYASEYDRTQMSDGWFDNHMPDLNQRHPRLAKYLTQNNIWWVEYTGINGYRIDTYAYPDQDFMATWGRDLLYHYPDITLFAETWVHGSPNQAWFTMNNNMRKEHNTHMPAVTDFQLYYAICEALNTPQGWMEGVSRLYSTLAHDFLYEDPYRNVTFLDNHDIDRFLSKIGEHPEKFKTGLNWLFTLRGIPMIYYGTEIGMKNHAHPDGLVREDFQGGWPEDSLNKFMPSGRDETEQMTFEYLQKLTRLRKTHRSLHSGKLTQFIPEQGIFTFFRHSDIDTIMVIANTNDHIDTLETKRFKEFLTDKKQLKDIMTGENLVTASPIILQPYESRILLTLN